MFITKRIQAETREVSACWNHEVLGQPSTAYTLILIT